METIKNYLETMFANMPNTEAVRKAKAELLTMMDDKYTELIAEGISENEAVGTVITEFGNLDELAEELGLEKEVEEEKEYKKQTNRRAVTLDEVKSYLEKEAACGFKIALAIALCIFSPVGCIVFEDVLNMNERYGVILLLLCIAAAIALFIYNVVMGNSMSYIVDEPCQIDIMTNDYVVDERRHYQGIHSIRLTVGILLLVLCWLPAALFDEISPALEDLSGAFVLTLVACGIFLIVHTNVINCSFDKVLKINDEKTISGNYKGKRIYINKTIANIMAVYWSTVACIYFIWSFLTFNWAITWIIWPIASLVKRIIDINLMEESDGE